MFVVFDYNTLVSSRALEVIWNKDSLETEELLMGIYKYSTNVMLATEALMCVLTYYLLDTKCFDYVALHFQMQACMIVM